METITLNGKEFTLPRDETLYQQTLRSYIWCTYRNYFDIIGSSIYSTDAGWGCMLRCGQMVLARAMTVARLGKDWLLTANGSGHDVYSKIIANFLDTPKAPFSIHRIAERGEKLDKRIGQWFGPNTIAQVLKGLVNEQNNSDLFVHTAMDGVLLKNVIVEEYSAALKSRKCSLLLLVPVRLGLQQSINSVYLTALKAIFTLPQTLGVIGGKPNAAHYFVGIQGSSALYLDPHTVQDAATQLNSETLGSFQNRTLSKVNLTDIDPSMCIVFLCSSVTDLEDLSNALKKINKHSTYGLFDVSESKNTPNIDNLTAEFDDEDEDMVLL